MADTIDYNKLAEKVAEGVAKALKEDKKTDKPSSNGYKSLSDNDAELSKALNKLADSNFDKSFIGSVDNVKIYSDGVKAIRENVEAQEKEWKRIAEYVKDLQDELEDALKNQRDTSVIEEKIRNAKELQADTLQKIVDLKEDEKNLSEEELKTARELYEAEKKGLTVQEKITKAWEQTWVNTQRVKTGVDELKQGLNGMKNSINGVLAPWAKVSQAAANYSREMGGSVQSMNKMVDSTIKLMNTSRFIDKYNISMEEMIKLQGAYNKGIGRSINLTNSQKESMAAMRKVAGEDTTIEFATKLESFGIAPEEAEKRMGKMFATASKHGLSFEKYSKNFLNNIQMAQNYTFARGLKGVDEMARRSTALRLNMEQATRFADKVSTLEGAIKTGASLSVLGGSFSSFGNPMSMLYEGLNDPEKLQERIVNMFGNLGKWDNEKGQVDVTAFNRQRIKAAAEASGLDYGNIMEMINTNARRNIIGNQLSGKNISKANLELLKNVGQLDQNGNAFVSVNGERKEISDLTAEDYRKLEVEHNSDTDNLRFIADSLSGFKDRQEAFEKKKEAVAAKIAQRLDIGNKAMSLLSFLSSSNWLLMSIKASTFAIQMTMNGWRTFNGMGNIGAGAVGSGKNIGSITFSGNGTPTAGGKTVTRPTRTNMPNAAYGGTMGGGSATTASPIKGAKAYQTSNGNIVYKKGNDFYNAKGGKLNASMTKNSGDWKPVKGGKMGGGLGYGASAGIGFAGAALSMGGAALSGNADAKLANGEINPYDSSYGWQKYGGNVLAGVGMGASMGAMFGPWGALAGAVIGGIGGAATAGVQQKKERLRYDIYRKFGIKLNGGYTIDELQAIFAGKNTLATMPELRDKMENQSDDWTQFLTRNHGGSKWFQSKSNPINIALQKQGVLNQDEGLTIAKDGEMITPSGSVTNAMKVTPTGGSNGSMGGNITIRHDMPSQITLKIDFGQYGTETTDILKDPKVRKEIANIAAQSFETSRGWGINHKDGSRYPFGSSRA